MVRHEGTPSGVSRRLRCSAVSDQVAVPSSSSNGCVAALARCVRACRAIAAGMAAAREIVQSDESALIEAADQARHGVMNALASRSGSVDQAAAAVGN